MPTNGFDIGSISIGLGSAQQPYLGGYTKTGEGIEVEPAISWGSFQKPVTGIFTRSGEGIDVGVSGVDLGSSQKPYYGYVLIGTLGQKFGVHALPVVPGDDAQLITMDDLWELKKPRTHTVIIEDGLIKSWTITNGGTFPSVHNSHEVVVEGGLIKSWTITESGEALPDEPNTHIVDILNGRVINWNGEGLIVYDTVNDSVYETWEDSVDDTEDNVEDSI